ncbi:MAG TPA: glycosyltransferase family 4 protein [Devosia sp.]|nr:glycosyltransferase family 4 protein [Devosia sp.]
MSCFYIDDALYQENELVREHVALGHNVRVIASTETMSKEGHLIYGEPHEYMGSDGAPVKRLPYRKILPQKIMRKLRMHPGVYGEIEAFSPDVIVFHGACGWEILNASRYSRRHPHVRFWIDSHEDKNNSARGFVSREGLHKRFYGPLLRRALPAGHSVLCISLETIDFVHEMYGIPLSRLEFFPLGGHPLPDAEYEEMRAMTRNRLAVNNDQVMFLQSGKFDRKKRLRATLTAFVATPDPTFRLFLSGVVMKDEDGNEIQRLIASDERITFLGWNSASEMQSLLAASDVYLQPGSQSVTMQNSICQRCAIVIDDVKSHEPYVRDNGYLTQAGIDLPNILSDISANKLKIATMRERSHALAMQMLDYSKQALRLAERTS